MNTSGDNEESIIEMMKQIFEMIQETSETKNTNELEVTLGDENMGDRLLISVAYLKAHKQGKNKKDKIILN